MKCFRLLLLLAMLAQGLSLNATPLENYPLSCSLPAPATVTATNITSSSIAIAWADVSGSYGYRVSRFDVTHGVALPDVDVAEPSFISEPHDPGTTIAFEVRAKCQSGDPGEAINVEYTTSIIIVDDIVFFSVPNNPIGDIPINPSGTSSDLTVGIKDADNHTEFVDVIRAKVKYTGSHNYTAYAEFLVWSHCSVAGNNGVRIQYKNQGSWPGNVTYIENHVGGNPQLPIYSINFKMNGMPFFTIHFPVFYQGLLGEPNSLRVRIRNDFESMIYYDRSFNVEDNPCYGSGNGGSFSLNVEDKPLEGIRETGGEPLADSQTSNESLMLIESPTLLVSPNPFQEGFNISYSLLEEGPVSFTLFDHTGREMKTIQLPNQLTGSYNTVMNTDNLPTGIYLLVFQTRQGRTATTLVKQP